MELSEPVRAALIGATVTIVTALLQLTVNARRQARERAAGQPASRKTGNWLAIFALMLASGVAGYALSEYQTFNERADSRMLRAEMQTQLREIGAAAVRLEQAGLQTSRQAGAETRLAVERQRGTEGIAAVINVPPCRGAPAGALQGVRACSEAEAVRATVCSVVPAQAGISEVQLFIRAEDSQQPWNEVRVQPGQEAAGAKFVDGHFERGREAGTKEVCANFAHWGGDGGRSARILVKYSL